MDNFDTLFPDERHLGETTLRQAQLVMLRILKIVDYICRKHHISYWLCSGTLLGAVRHKGFIPWDDDLDIAMLREDYERFIQVAKEELPDDLHLQTTENESAYDYLPVPCKIRDTKSLMISSYLDKQKYHKGIAIDIFPFDRFHRFGLKNKKDFFLKSYNWFISQGYDADIGKDTSTIKVFVSWFKPVFRWLLQKYQRYITTVINHNQEIPDQDCFVGHGFNLPWTRKMNMNEIFPLQEISFEGQLFYAPCNTDAYLKYIYGDTYMTPPPKEKQVPPHGVIIKPML